MPILGWVNPIEGLVSQAALWPYVDPLPGLAVAAKNAGRRQVLAALGGELGRWGRAEGALSYRAAMVTWVPASRGGQRRRGFDQGRVLASEVGRALGIPARRLLVRRSDGSRLGSGRVARLLGPDLRAPLGCPESVILVDDVCTTGSSLRVAARLLAEAGATSVVGLTLARVENR